MSDCLVLDTSCVFTVSDFTRVLTHCSGCQSACSKASICDKGWSWHGVVLCRLDASMIDTSALNSAELVPIRSQTACIQLLSTTAAHTSAGRVRSAGGSSSKVLLQLPAAGSTPAADAVGTGSGGSSGGSSSGHVSQYGGAVWKELVQTQQEQAAKAGAGRKVDGARVSWPPASKHIMPQDQHTKPASTMPLIECHGHLRPAPK
jgi:hypothetical protein